MPSRQMSHDGAEIGQWFAVYSKPRREAEAVEQLDRQGYVAFLPRVRARRRLRGQWREMVEPMFPRYLFLRATLGEDNLAPVRSTRGVIGLVRFEGRPRPVPEPVMIELRRLCGGEKGALELPQPLNPGSQVRILEGPFAGCEAELLDHDGERRAVVLLELLGRPHALEMPADNLAII
ncbi:MAG: transcription termination/antitermination NusG family protein [Candidatus Competibacter sp.]|nr:transcription termination/antitermination NusG family protein [Candidatus Competibacter sp.]